jgi:hypothetical protein
MKNHLTPTDMRGQAQAITVRTPATPLDALVAQARRSEERARWMECAERFGRIAAAAFPTLWRHAAIRPTRAMLPALQQWTFALDGIEYLAQWHSDRAVWAFTAWAGMRKVASRDTRGYYTSSPETALLCFIGDARAKAATIIAEKEAA